MGKEDSEILLFRRLSDLAERAARSGVPMYSPFISMAEQDLLLRRERELPAEPVMYGGFAAAERKLVRMGDAEAAEDPEAWPICVLEILPVSEKFGEELDHRDYLGAVLSLGIDRGLIGDIVIRGKHAWLLCRDSIAGYIAENLTSVRRTAVRCGILSGEVPELSPVLKELRLNVASDRMDGVVAAWLKLSRAKSLELFRRQRIYVNGRLQEEGSKCLKEGDVLSARGFGKAVYRGVDNQTRKGRLYVILAVYQ